MVGLLLSAPADVPTQAPVIVIDCLQAICVVRLPSAGKQPAPLGMRYDMIRYDVIWSRRRATGTAGWVDDGRWPKSGLCCHYLLKSQPAFLPFRKPNLSLVSRALPAAQVGEYSSLGRKVVG